MSTTTIQLTPKVATSAHDTCGCKQATIFTDFDGVKHSIWYQGIDDMMLKTFEYLFVDCIVTSPPYYGLRNYGVDGQIGLEESPEHYIKRLTDVFTECYRAL